jgi:hypothetical protein
MFSSKPSCLQKVFATITPLVPDVCPASHNSTRGWIMDVYKRKRTQIRQRLSLSKSQINLSFDLWSSSNGLLLCGVVGHFIDEQAILRTLLLGLREIVGEHSGENIAGAVIGVIKGYSIASKIGYFVLDNAKNNDAVL